jgi:MtN3 and saliva related transmembrane protein
VEQGTRKVMQAPRTCPLPRLSCRYNPTEKYPGAKTMNLDSPNTVGLIAGALTTLAFIPQVLKTWKSKHARDISLSMFAIFSFGVLLWLLYGIQIEAWPVIIANAVTLVMSLTILIFKIKYP